MRGFARYIFTTKHHYMCQPDSAKVQVSVMCNDTEKGGIHLTKNQIEYQKLLKDREALEETKRANRRNEELTRARDQRTLDIRDTELGEAARHNIAQEIETARANKAKEQENTLHNRAQEAIGQGQVGVGYGQIQLGYSQLGESSQHNRATEGAELRKIGVQQGELDLKKGTEPIKAVSSMRQAEAAQLQAAAADYRARTDRARLTTDMIKYTIDTSLKLGGFNNGK